MSTSSKPDEKLTAGGISGASENHPVGTGVGAVGGAVAGAALGSAAGPLGSLTGAVIGTVAGAIAGKGIAEGINPETEENFWKESFRKEPYHLPDYEFEDYGPAYRLGIERYHADASFESAEATLAEEWQRERQQSRLDWKDAKPAARASWERVHHTLPKKN